MLREHLPGVEVWAYGSRANGLSHDGSDLDLVLRGHGLTEIDASRLGEFTDALRESTIPFLVETRDWARLPESFHREIEREHVVLVAADQNDGPKRKPRGSMRTLPPTSRSLGIASEWRKYDVSALIHDEALVIGDGYRARNAELSNAGLPFARAGNIRNGFQFSDAECFPEDELHKVGEKISQPGDTVFTSKGTVGRFAFVKKDTPRFVYSPQLCYWRSLNTEIIEPRFLYYWMASREFFSQFKSVAGQTDMAEYVSLGDQRRMHITVPPLLEQRAIAHILGTLDDKIELNRRMNETLEAMARALFKSWFVDFDPVRAKMAGRDPGLPKHIADLFPDLFVDSELGEIPEGWEVSTIGQEVDVVGGSTPSTKDPSFWNGAINWATPKDLSSLASPVLVETSRRISEKGLGKISSGLLPRGTVLLSSRAPIGYLAIADVPIAINQGFIAMKCRKRLSAAYVWLWTAANIDSILENANGSTFQEISKTNFRPLPAIVPHQSIREIHDQCIRSLYNRIVKNERGSRTLAALRDALLPKLITGELRVKNAGVFFAGAS